MTSLDEIADTIEAFPDVLAALLGPIADATLRQQPEAGEWCPLEVIGHLIVTDGAAFRDRIAAIIGGQVEIAPFDSNLARTGRDFRVADLSDLLVELRGERAKSGAFLRALDPVDLRRTGSFVRGGSFAAGDFVHEWPFHDHDHLQQILASIKTAYVPFMTEAMRRALLA